MTVPDQRGVGKQIKRVLPPSAFRFVTVIYNSIMRLVPFHFKYGVGMRLRQDHAPYRFLEPTDTVVQVGCARDILRSGRSRVMFLSRRVPKGKVVLLEADGANCRAVRQLIKRHRIRNIEVVACGAWETTSKLAFLSSPKHPASNLLVDVNEITEDQINARQYEESLIDVDTIDNVLEQLGAAPPKLVSITTNGAELKILAGMRKTILHGCEYISLASTGQGFHRHMHELGYEYVARDDRGYCFQKRETRSDAEAA